VEDLVAVGEQVVGDDPSVAAPPHRLGAHHGGGPLGAPAVQVVEGVAELLGQRVVGVVVEAAVLPPAVDLVGHALARSSSGEALRPHQVDADRGERRAERVLVELRVPPRARQPADVDDQLDAGPREQVQELVDRPVGVADREDPRGHRDVVSRRAPSAPHRTAAGSARRGRRRTRP
jgi:hypothetical protein